MTKRKIIDYFFEGENSFLDNFYPSTVFLNGARFPTAEHAFQATKMDNSASFLLIWKAKTPAEAKKIGNSGPMRPDWNFVRYKIMKKIVTAKFQQHPDLAKKLLETGDALIIEGNHWHDNTWGNCTCSECKATPGKNWLGKILMEVRAELL